MTTVDITTPTGSTDGSVELPGEIFDVQSNVPLMHQVVVAQLAAARQGTHSTKTRAEVRGGGAKPYRQKGTGRARQGSTRSPQFAGGGISHGPVPRGYSQRTPKKMKAAALRGALSDRARSGNVHVLSSLVEGELPSTRTAIAALARVSDAKNILVVVAREDEAGWKSLRNSAQVHLISSDQLNTYDVLVSDDVVFTKVALDEFLAFAKRGIAVDTPADEVTSEHKPVITEKVVTAKAEKVVTEKSEKKAAPAKLADVPESDTADADSGEAKDFGPDSHAPLADGSEPEGFPIKGNADSMLYHVPDTRFYNATVAEEWFRTAEAAEAAGFLLPPSQRKDDAADNTQESDK